MADVTHSSRSYIKGYRVRVGEMPIKSYQESTAASSAVIGFGQVVQFDDSTSAHRIRRASTAIGVAPFLGGNVVGISVQASTSDGSTTGLTVPSNRRLLVCEARPDVEFLFPTKGVISDAVINTGMELSWDSTLNIHHVSSNSSAADLTVMITDYLPGTVGDTGGYYVGRFYSSVVARSVSGV